jgi:nitrogen regulatory protein PII
MQYLVLMVLHDVARLNEVLVAWEDAGVGGVTVIASTGLGRIREQVQALRDDLPLIPSIHDLLVSANEEILNRTLFSIVESEELAERIVHATERVLGDLSGPRRGIIAILPLARVYGIDRSWKDEREDPRR